MYATTPKAAAKDTMYQNYMAVLFADHKDINRHMTTATKTVTTRNMTLFYHQNSSDHSETIELLNKLDWYPTCVFFKIIKVEHTLHEVLEEHVWMSL